MAGVGGSFINSVISLALLSFCFYFTSKLRSPGHWKYIVVSMFKLVACFFFCSYYYFTSLLFSDFSFIISLFYKFNRHILKRRRVLIFKNFNVFFLIPHRSTSTVTKNYSYIFLLEIRRLSKI